LEARRQACESSWAPRLTSSPAQPNPSRATLMIGNLESVSPTFKGVESRSRHS